MLDPAHPEFWVLISALGFVALLFYYQVPGLVARALDERAEAIRKELDEARRLREEAQQLLAEYRRKSREADQEAKAMIEQAQREAEALTAETRATLGETLERRTKLAEEKIRRAEAEALAEVRATAVDVALAVAERILRRRVAGEAGKALIEESIREVKTKLN